MDLPTVNARVLLVRHVSFIAMHACRDASSSTSNGITSAEAPRHWLATTDMATCFSLLWMVYRHAQAGTPSVDWQKNDQISTEN